MVKDINLGSWNSTPFALTNVNWTLYFSITTDATYWRELWKSNWTDAWTVMVKDITTGTWHWITANTASFTNVNGTLFFAATNWTSWVELWKSDWTDAWTVMVKDIYSWTNASIGYSDSPITRPSFTAIWNILYFTARSWGGTNYELWKSDWTDAWTVMVKEIFSWTTWSYPTNLTNVDWTLYFVATEWVNWVELWKSDWTDAWTVMVKNIYPWLTWSYPANLTNVNWTLYFSALHAIDRIYNLVVYWIELWKSDWTESWTVMIKDIYFWNVNWIIQSSAYFTKVWTKLYFVANNWNRWNEIWETNGTDSWTLMINDIYSWTTWSNPTNLVDVNGTLFFTTNTSANWIELWKK